MKDEASAGPTQSTSLGNDDTTASHSNTPGRTPSTSARQSRIRQSASESSTPINFARPLFDQESAGVRPSREASADTFQFESSAAPDSEDADWQDVPRAAASDRRAANTSFASDHSAPLTPLMVRRRGMINDKRLTISIGAPSRSSSSRRVASESSTSVFPVKTPSSGEPQARPANVARSLPNRSTRLAAGPSADAYSPVSPGTKVAESSSKKDSSPINTLAPPPSAGIRWTGLTDACSPHLPYSPAKASPLADKKRSPTTASTGSGSTPSPQSSGSTESSKPLLKTPQYGLNPDFQLGGSSTAKSGSKLSPTAAIGSSSPRDGKDASPTKPSPTYAGASLGGVKSMLYSGARIPTTPLSPRAPNSSQRSPGLLTVACTSPRTKLPSTPRSPRAPGTPRTPRTPMTARLPATPYLTGSGSSYQGVLLTTITQAPSDPDVNPDAESSAAGRKTRNRSASIATEIRGFLRGGGTEAVPRLELRVLERPNRRSQLYNLESEQIQTVTSEVNKRHSLAAVQPSVLREKDEKLQVKLGEQADDDASPRTSAFARSAALSKLTRRRSSIVSKPPAFRRADSAITSTGNGLYPYVRRERRDTAGTTNTTATAATAASGRSGLSARSDRSNLSRRVSMPTATAVNFKSRRTSSVKRRMSLAPPSVRDDRDDDESEDENDIVAEMQSQVNNITEAKKWILEHRPSYGNTASTAAARHVMDDNRPVTAMRRPTYAASVFQQARLMEAERQASAAIGSASALDVASGGANALASNLHRGTPTPFPRTPSFPKTPLSAFPAEAQLAGLEEEGAEPASGAEAAVAALPKPTWKDKSVHYLKAPFRFIAEQIDPKYVWTMMDPREIIFPITIRKVALWIIYGGVIAMLVLLDHYYHWWHKLDHAVHGKNYYIMGVLYGFEPCMILIIMLVARVPDARLVPDRTVLVPRGRDSTDTSESGHSSGESDNESVASADMANQVHSTIIEEEHGEHDEAMQEQAEESGIVDRDDSQAKRLSGVQRPPMRRMSTRFATASGERRGSNGERRGSEAPSHPSSSNPPRTPLFDPRNRRSTIILHEPLNLDNLGLERQISRRPSGNSHQLVLARTASHETRRDSRRGSYFSVVAAAAGSRLGAPSPAPVTNDDDNDEEDEKDIIIPTKTSPAVDFVDEKKAMQAEVAEATESVSNDDICVDMGGVTHPSLTESTALIIPCHNSDAEVLKAVLFAALVHFEPWQIFIIDNGNSAAPPTDLEASIRSQPMFARVNYIWLPVGNKNIAQFVGAKAAAVLDLDYVLTIDDDVIIPANFAAPMHIISPTVTAVCYPITAVDHKGDRPLFVGWQDIEYKMSALAKMAESKMCGVLFPHGAASFWNRETLVQVLRKHDLIYFADDVKMGLELQALGQKMGVDASISFETVAPETFLGPPRHGIPNYYNQRVRSWEMARHTLYWQFSKRFLFSLNGARGPVAIGWQKFTQFYNSTTNFIDWIRLPYFVLAGGSGGFWLHTFAFIFFAPILPLIPYRFIKTRNRPDLHPHMLDMLTFGVYKLMYSLVCILGGLRSMLVFFPNHKHKPNLVEMERDQDPRCIWLREDFMQNSGGQGDLRDEHQHILIDDRAVVDEVAPEPQQEMEETTVVAALPSDADSEAEQVAVVTVTRPLSQQSPEELPTVHEVL